MKRSSLGGTVQVRSGSPMKSIRRSGMGSSAKIMSKQSGTATTRPKIEFPASVKKELEKLFHSNDPVKLPSPSHLSTGSSGKQESPFLRQLRQRMKAGQKEDPAKG